MSEKTDLSKPKTSLFIGIKKDKNELMNELLIPVLIFSTMGAFYWAIRGTGGYGGSSGGIFAGIGWAVTWLFLSHESGEKKSRQFSSGWIVLAIMAGIGFGGTHGYGQFMSWIRGYFMVNGLEDTVAINPLIGYLWLFQCGLAWGGTAGIFMAWTGSKKPPTKFTWIARFSFGIGGALIGYYITIFIPQLINPLYGTVDYSNCLDCERTLSTSASSMALLGAYLGFLLFELLRKECRGSLMALIMGVGFGLAFSIFAFWHYGNEVTGVSFDWWKLWEMSIGFYGGATIGICYYLFNRPLNDDEVLLVMEQPFSSHRNAEKLLGVDFAMAFAIGFSIYNGVGGFMGKIGIEGPWGLIISIPFIIACLVLFLFSVYKTLQNPYKNGDDKSNIQKPFLKFLVTFMILIILGYMVSLPTELSLRSLFLPSSYTALLVICSIFIYLKWRKLRSHEDL